MANCLAVREDEAAEAHVSYLRLVHNQREDDSLALVEAQEVSDKQTVGNEDKELAAKVAAAAPPAKDAKVEPTSAPTNAATTTYPAAASAATAPSPKSPTPKPKSNSKKGINKREMAD